jgi:hypothetical protein
MQIPLYSCELEIFAEICVEDPDPDPEKLNFLRQQKIHVMSWGMEVSPVELKRL